MPKRVTAKEFIEKIIEVHGDRYDYSKVEYINYKAKVVIICKEHGEFTQRPDNHSRGQGCPLCNAKKRISNTKEWIERATGVHDGKYDYSKVVYDNYKSRMTIICPEHGEFEQSSTNHLSGHGCWKCTSTYIPTTKEFIDKATEIHKDIYDYSKVKYKHSLSKIIIICKKHGEFTQRVSSHLEGYGCPECSIENSTSTLEEFIEKAIEIHGDKYDYSKSIYTNCKDYNTIIICKKHGEFNQSPAAHIHGSGCPSCSSSKGEEKIHVALTRKGVIFEREKSFKELGLGRKRYDFHLPELKMCIEYDGVQHFEPVKHWGGEKALEKVQLSDEIKNKFCEDNGIELLRIPYWQFDDIDDILERRFA